MTDIPIRYGMKRKSIIERCDKVLTAWLASIKDTEVRDAARRDCILTGGALASMLLGEKVNDYDIYFRYRDTVEKVAKYYAERFIEDNPGRPKPEVKVEGDRVSIFIRSAGITGEAGCRLDEDTGNVERPEGDEEPRIKYRPVFFSPNAITLSDKIQLILRFYGDVGQIHTNFDFVHATSSYTYHNQNLDTPAEALEALLSRTLVYRGSLYPIASLFRAKKFIDRGWRMNAGQYLKMAFQINDLNMKDIKVLNDQLIGVDATYMLAFLAAIKTVSADKLNSYYVAEIVDRVFDEPDWDGDRDAI